MTRWQLTISVFLATSPLLIMFLLLRLMDWLRKSKSSRALRKIKRLSLSDQELFEHYTGEPLSDQQRIKQLERENAQLREVVKYLVPRAVFENDLAKGVERLRQRAQDSLVEAEIIEQLIPLIKP